MSVAAYLYEHWLPESGEQCAEFPVFFHDVNVGPEIKEEDMVTDVYLPIFWVTIYLYFKQQPSKLSKRNSVTSTDYVIV